MTSDQDQWFWNVLARAGKLERERILSSDEAFEEYLKANPLTPEEQKEADAAVERLRARLLKTAESFLGKCKNGSTECVYPKTNGPICGNCLLDHFDSQEGKETI